MAAFVIRYDVLPEFAKEFPAIKLPEGTDALGIETDSQRAVLLEAFGETDETAWDETLVIPEGEATALWGFAERFGDLC